MSSPWPSGIPVKTNTMMARPVSRSDFGRR
jgi:hypothetical protein